MRFSFYRIFILSLSVGVLLIFALNSIYNSNKSPTRLLKPYLLREQEARTKRDDRVLCIVMTAESTFLQRSVTVWNTWAKKCDKTLFACNCKNLSSSLNSTMKEIPIWQIDIVEDYNMMAKKALFILESAYEKYNEQFKWFLLVDDDSYVFVKHLKHFIRAKSYLDPLTYGYNFKTVVQGGYHSGGGGILFTHESLKLIYNSIKNGACNIEIGHGDVAIGECSVVSNVKIGNSLDQLGRERFHTLDIASHYTGNFPDWLLEYSQNGLKKGVECCSEKSITFHYTSVEQMIAFEKFGTQRTFSSIYKYLNLQ